MDGSMYMCVRGRGHHINSGNKYRLNTVLTILIASFHIASFGYSLLPFPI